MTDDTPGGGDDIANVDDLDQAGWERHAAVVSPADYGAMISAVTQRSALVAAVASARAVERTDGDALAQGALVAAARRFPSTTTGWMEAHDIERASERLEREFVEVASELTLSDVEADAWRARLLAERREPAASEEVERLAMKVMNEEGCAAFLRDRSLSALGESSLWRRGLLRAVARIAPTQLIDHIHGAVRNEALSSDGLRNLSWTLQRTVDLLGSGVVAEAGVVLASEDQLELRKVVVAQLEPAVVARMEGIADAHAALARAARVDATRGDVLASQGAHAAINQRAAEQADDWADYLRIALWRRESDQALVQPTIVASRKSTRIGDVLREMLLQETAPEPRDRARALLALVEGVGVERPSRDALLRLVELVDGPSAFPTPLRIASSTWLGSLELEALLRGRIRGATDALARELPAQLGRNEEKLTTRILTTLQRALEDAVTVARASTDAGKRVEITCEYRELSKDQEKADGADVAWLLDVDIPSALRFRQAEFAQAKKAVREADGTFSAKWSIDTAQLKRLLTRSQTAVYWLYAPDGVIHVVPARLILAVLAGDSRETGAHARVDLAHIRSMSIPLAQFLVDLFTGVWLGSGRADALSVAQGDVAGDKPDVLFEVRVRGKVHG